MNKKLVLIGACALAILAGCDKKEETPTTTAEPEMQQPQQPQEPVATTDSAMSQEKDEFVAKTEEAINGMESQIKELEGRAQVAKDDAKKELEQQAQNLRQELEQTRTKLTALKNESGDAWKNMKEDVSASVQRLKDACDRATAESSLKS